MISGDHKTQVRLDAVLYRDVGAQQVATDVATWGLAREAPCRRHRAMHSLKGDGLGFSGMMGFGY